MSRAAGERGVIKRQWGRESFLPQRRAGFRFLIVVIQTWKRLTFSSLHAPPLIATSSSAPSSPPSKSDPCCQPSSCQILLRNSGWTAQTIVVIHWDNKLRLDTVLPPRRSQFCVKTLWQVTNQSRRSYPVIVLPNFLHLTNISDDDVCASKSCAFRKDFTYALTYPRSFWRYNLIILRSKHIYTHKRRSSYKNSIALL